jgi:DUF4097 and DUF4098 domain-containing protein YvlB
MDKVIKLTTETTVTLKAAGDLALVAGPADQMTIRTSRAEQLNLVQTDKDIRIFCLNDAEIEVPPQFPLIVEKVSGDVFVAGLTADIHTVGGDAALKQAIVTITRVGGDVMADDCPSLQLRQCGGDFTGRNIGSLNVENIGGDMAASVQDFHKSINVGGDLILTLATLPEDGSIHVGGDARVILPAGMDAALSLKSGSGDIDYDLAGDRQVYEMTHTLEKTLGKGGSLLSIFVGGDITISDQHSRDSKSADYFGDMEVQLGALADDIGREVRIDQRVAARLDSAARRAEEAARRAEQRIQAAMQRVEARHGGFPPIPPSPVNLGGRPPVLKRSVSNEERMLILQMLQEKKITVEEAERLLQALEGAE